MDVDRPDEVREAQLDPKRVFGKYVMVALVGKGGMGEVWKSWDRELGRWVALKFLMKGSEDDRKRFQREAQITARLAHPNIVAVHDIGEHQGRPFIAMHFVDGHSLADEKVPVRRACEVVRDAARAVHFAHQQGMIHRDLKPANLMIDKGHKTYVTDFGLVRPAKEQSTISHAGSIMGTPSFMSPEQADARKLDARTDIYSLGATLYTLVTGRLPFMGETPAQTLVKVITKEPAPPRELRPDVPRDIETIILKAMEKEPSRRYRSAQSLADDIQRYLDGEGIHAHPPSLGYRLKKIFAKRKTALVAATAATVAAAVLATVLVSQLMTSRAFEAARAEAKTAFAASQWGRAQAAAEAALRLRPDRELHEIADASKSRFEAEAIEKERLAKNSRLSAKLGPVHDLIKETRQHFYIKGTNIREKLDRVEKALRELRSLADSSEFGAAPEVWRLLGVGAYFAGDNARAEEALLRAEKLLSTDPMTCYYLGRICLENSLMARMSARGGSAEEREKRSRAFTERAVRYIQAGTRGAFGSEEVDQHVAEVFRAYALEKRDEARRSCEEGLRRFGSAMGTEEYHNLIGFTSRGAECVRAYTQAIDIRPHYAWGYFMRGNARFDIGDLEGSERDYGDALRVNPRFVMAWNNRGVTRSTRRDFEGAVEDLGEAIRLDAKFADAWYNRGNAFKGREDYEKAIADYSEALRLDDTMHEARLNRGNCKYRSGDAAGGLGDIDETIKRDPTVPDGYASRAVIKDAKGDLNGAIQDLTEALRVAPPGWVYRATCERHLAELKRKRDQG